MIEKINDKVFEDVYDLSEDMLDIEMAWRAKEDRTVHCISKAEDIAELLFSLIGLADNAHMGVIDLDATDPSITYVLSYYYAGYINVHPYNQNNSYYITDPDDIVYVYDECNSRVLKSIDPKTTVISYHYDEDDDIDCDAYDGCDFECDDCPFDGDDGICVEGNQKLHGFQMSTAKEDGKTEFFSFYSDDKDLVYKMADDLKKGAK